MLNGRYQHAVLMGWSAREIEREKGGGLDEAKRKVRFSIPDERISLKADLHFLDSISLFPILFFPFSSIPYTVTCSRATEFDSFPLSFRVEIPRIQFTFDFSQVESQTRHQPQQRWDRNDAHSDQEDLQWIEIRMNLQPFHFSNGQLNLQCNAQIPGVYSKMSEIHLGGGLREPVPERGNTSFIAMISIRCDGVMVNVLTRRDIDGFFFFFRFNRAGC